MVEQFKLPELGETFRKAISMHLMIAPWRRVSKGQPIMELETDKAVGKFRRR
jgi:pyruvate/2-oxoglutarate dehydrogenase complex dihydrolipoamide acyltransferase (E2) component